MSPDGLLILKTYEGCELEAYPDPATGGAPWTIGWGETGPGIVRGLKWTQQQADNALVARLAQEFEPGVRAAVPVADQAQFDAMVSFAYNVGVRAFSDSTLVKKHNAQDYIGASQEFARWNKAAGKVMLGLVRRRESERVRYCGHSGQAAVAAGQAIKG